MGWGGSERHECRNTGDNFYLLFFYEHRLSLILEKKTIYYIQSLAEVSGPRFKLFPSPPKIVYNCDCLRNDEKKTTRRHFFFPKLRVVLVNVSVYFQFLEDIDRQAEQEQRKKPIV